MRQVAISMIIIGLLAGLGLWTNNLLQKSAQQLVIRINNVAAEINDGRWAEALEHTRELEKAWSAQVGWWPVILDHQEIDNIEFSDRKSVV